jgi:aspartate/methionine/tyrosine aminotransferase
VDAPYEAVRIFLCRLQQDMPSRKRMRVGREDVARLEGVTPWYYQLRYDDGWTLEHEQLSQGFPARAVLLVSPNNPTGSFLSELDLAFVDMLASAQEAAVVCDEVFADYGADPRLPAPSLLRTEPSALTFVLSGLSKLVGLPQLKLAWIVVRGPTGLRREALARLHHIADASLSVAAPVQVAAARLLAQRPRFQRAMHARLQRNWLTLVELTRKAPEVTLLRRQAGWYAVLRLPELLGEEQWVTTLLTEDGVVVQPGWFYDFGGGAHIVVSLLPAPGVMAEAVPRIAARVAALCR